MTNDTLRALLALTHSARRRTDTVIAAFPYYDIDDLLNLLDSISKLDNALQRILASEKVRL